MQLARLGVVRLALRPPHVLMSLYTLTANLGAPPRTDRGPLFDPAVASRAYRMIAELAALQPEEAYHQDPIAVFEAMAGQGSAIALSPLAYGYVPYAQDGFRPHRLAFADIAATSGHGVTARRSAARALRCPPFRASATPLSISPISSPRARCRRGPMQPRAASPAMPRPGRPSPSMRRSMISTAPRGQPWRAPGSARATTATWRSRTRLAPDQRRSPPRREAGEPVIADLNRMYAESHGG